MPLHRNEYFQGFKFENQQNSTLVVFGFAKKKIPFAQIKTSKMEKVKFKASSEAFIFP